MIADALKFLADLGKQAAGARVVPVDGMPDHQILLQLPDGKVEAKTLDPEPRAHQATDLDTITAWAKSGARCVVWVNRSAITLLLDDSTRRDRVTLPLSFTPQLLALIEQMTTRKQWKQPELIYWLRTMFRDSLGAHPNLVAVLRRINWQASTEAQTEVRRDKVSVGKAIQQQVSGITEVPEIATLEIPLFVQPLGVPRQLIEVAIEPNIPGESFSFVPIPGAIEAAIQAGEQWLIEQLGERIGDAAPVYYGQP